MALTTLYDAQGNPVQVDLQDDPADGETPLTNSEAARLRQATKAREKAEADLVAQRKENVFLRAGLDLEQPAVSDFFKAYEGDLDLAAVKAAATTRGYLGQVEAPAEQVPDSGSPDVDQAAHQAAARIASAGQGSTPDTRTDTAKMADAFASGGSAAVEDFLRERGFIVAGQNQ